MEYESRNITLKALFNFKKPKQINKMQVSKSNSIQNTQAILICFYCLFNLKGYVMMIHTKYLLCQKLICHMLFLTK